MILMIWTNEPTNDNWNKVMSHSQFHSIHNKPNSLMFIDYTAHRVFHRSGSKGADEVETLNNRTLNGPVFHQLMNMDNVKLLFNEVWWHWIMKRFRMISFMKCLSFKDWPKLVWDCPNLDFYAFSAEYRSLVWK